MKKTIIFVLISMLTGSLFAQQADKEIFNIQLNFIPDYIDFSPSDNYLVLENEDTYEVWNVKDQKKILDNNHRLKIVNRNAENPSRVTEGSGYFLFEPEKIFLTVDYTLNNTKLKAYDLERGEKLWSNDKLDMDLSTVEQIYRLVDININTPGGSLSNTGPMPVDPNYFTKDQTLNKLINYMPEWSTISVNGSEGLQIIDLKTGETKWTQPELKGGIGEIFYDPSQDILIALRVHNSEIENLLSKPEVYGLNAKTGDVLWKVKYMGDFIPNLAFVHEGVLVLPYYGLQLIDVNNGKELDGDLKASMKRARKVARTMSVGIGASTEQNNDSNPILDEHNIVHYFVGYQGGKHLNPTMGKKAYFQIDIKNDKFVHVEEKLAGLNNNIITEALTDKMFYVKLTKGMSKSYILGMDRKTGKKVFETDQIKKRTGSEQSPFTLTENDRIVDLSKNGIHIYDANTGKETTFIAYKKFGVGKFRHYTPYKNGLVLFGTKGVAIADNSGNVKKVFNDLGRIKDYRIGHEIWLQEKKRFTRINTETLEKIDTIEFKGKEAVFYSPSGNYFVKTNKEGTNINIYTM